MDADLYRARRAGTSGEPRRRSRNPHPGRRRRARDGGSPRHRPDRSQLRRHGGDRCRRSRARAHRAARLSRRLRAARRPEPVRSAAGRGARPDAGARAHVRRRLAATAEPDAAGYAGGRRGLGHSPPAAAAAQDLRAGLAFHGKHAAAAAQLHLLPAQPAGRRVSAISAARATRKRLAPFRARRQPQPAHYRSAGAVWSCCRRSRRPDRRRAVPWPTATPTLAGGRVRPAVTSGMRRPANHP